MSSKKKIRIEPNGPYIVEGGVSLVRKSKVVSEHGEPLTWKKGELLSSEEEYWLCRCGQSSNKPFCDDSHLKADFNGDESADTGPVADRQKLYEGTKIVMKNDGSICTHAGFCGNRVTNVWKMTRDTDDTQVRAQVMAMIERCPSGSLAYALEAGGEDLEPDLPVEIAVTPDGPLWVTGGVEVERSDGQPFESRNRVTLCRCGASKNKPLCDGSHQEIGFTSD